MAVLWEAPLIGEDDLACSTVPLLQLLRLVTFKKMFKRLFSTSVSIRLFSQTYGHQGGESRGLGGGGGMNWEIGMDMYTLICTKYITNKNLLYKK